MSDLHDRVRRTRESIPMSITEVALKAGVRAEHLSRFERGARDMSGTKLGRVLDVLGMLVTPEEVAAVAAPDDADHVASQV